MPLENRTQVPQRGRLTLAERTQAVQMEPARGGQPMEERSMEEQSTQQPSTEEPSTEEPSTEEPSTEEPSTEEPSTEEPSTEEVVVSSKTLEPRPLASLSPSRASEFKSCPLRYRLRTIDRIPEAPSVAASRGTLVHAALESLFDLPARDRSLDPATELLEPEWAKLLAAEPQLEALLFGPAENWERHLAGDPLLDADPALRSRFFEDARNLLATYFELEDPRRLEPADRELPVSAELPSGLTLRGIIDRVDKAPTGEIRIVDYKTGRSPRAGWEGKALFQMRFYGLVHWLTTGEVPARLQLMYLGNREILSEDPTEDQLRSTQAQVEAIWTAVETALTTGDWKPKKSKLCDYCSFQKLCPEWGGTPPPLPLSQNP